MRLLYSNRSGIVTSQVPILVMGMICTTLRAGPPHVQEPGWVGPSRVPARSGGSYQLRRTSTYFDRDPYNEQADDRELNARAVDAVFDGFDFLDSGWIPPDPIGAAGTDRLIAVGNSLIEARGKTGTLLWRDTLQDFFTPLGAASFAFDPKIVYDQYENRFVVIALEREAAGTNPSPSNTSRILLAVSKTATPATAVAADWYYHAINAKESIGGYDHWADYPGFEVDEEAVYVTVHMYAHDGGTTNYRARLWIVDKGVGGGFYAGGAGVAARYDPYNAAGLAGYDSTTMPVQVYGAGGVGPGIGTFLVQYSGLTWGGPEGPEALVVIRVDDPLGVPSFSGAFVDIGDIEDIGGKYDWPALPDAPQAGTETRIEVNDRRALDAVWRNNRLWLTTTINPNSGPDAGHTTAHWIRLDTTSWPPTVSDQGDIGGEDIHPSGNVYTFFPSLAVNSAGDAKFGFAASSAAIYPGAYVTGREAGDLAGTVWLTETIRAGLDYYQRTYGSYPTDRNRWGDYSGASLDPTDDNVFWIFNEYAITRGDGVSPEDGRWGTAWASCSFTPVCGDGVVNGADVCDDGYTDTCGACNEDCTGAGSGSTCGDGDICPEAESCDDGNTNGGEGCSSICAVEPGWTCTGEPSVCTSMCVPSSPAEAEMIGLDISTKNRFLSFTAGNAGQQTALRVTLVDLPPPFDIWNGSTMWVGPPSEVTENGALIDPDDPLVPPGTPTFQAATLECTATPHCMDWSTVGVVHVLHEGIIPSKLAASTGPIEIPAVYDIQIVDCECDLGAESSYSEPLTMSTAGWGDTVRDLTTTPPGPPDEGVAIGDATAIIGRFVSDPASIIKARADLEGPDGCIDLTINISDVVSAISGFQGLDYPFEPSALNACDSTCPNPLP